MQRPLQITFHNIDQSEALEVHIREKIAKLEQFYPKITGCHVTVEFPHRHRHQGKPCDVRIDITVPSKALVITRQADSDPYVALRDAFDAAKRQLEDYVQIQRREIKNHQLKEIETEALSEI